VVGGAAVIGAILGATWGIAAWNSRGDSEPTDRLAPTMFEVGRVGSVAATIDDSGPILFPGLNTTSGERTLVLDHRGADPAHGWHAYWAYPADREASCSVTQVAGTRRFVDCDGRQLSTGDLAPPEGVCPVVDDTTLYVDLRCTAGAPAATA
jgi:hypothetical protein